MRALARLVVGAALALGHGYVPAETTDAPSATDTPSATNTPSATDAPSTTDTPLEIRVGVRADAEPFSYRASRYDDLEILKGYGGYMVEICRRVLKRMTASGPFGTADVVPVEVSSENRFHALEKSAKVVPSRHVDMLCGPDSITLARLEKFNASHPLFLSGITFLRVRELPQGAHCKSVIGLVANTTAQREGLSMLARSGELVRFDKALDAWLAAAPEASSVSAEEPSSDEKLDRALSNLADGLAGKRKERGTPSRGDPSSIITSECPNGYETKPVRYFDDHDEGVAALCSNEVLYYIGDFDILDRKVSDRKGCQYLARRETLTRESYGVYFRKPNARNEQDMLDATLYAEFNNVLLQKMESEDILRYEFRREFAPAEPSPDLERFFESFRYATH